MLDEAEWSQVAPLLSRSIANVMEYRKETGSSLAEAHEKAFGREALKRYFEITGFRESNVNALWHHRLSEFGPECRACGRPLRTPRASHCAECGAVRA